MPEPLSDLEGGRSQILVGIARLGDFRRGSVRASFCRCGKLSCACARCNSTRGTSGVGTGPCEAVRVEAAYFEGQADCMRYADFRRQDLLVGSGVMRSGCRTVAGRLKRSGMFRAVDGANAINTLRCAHLSNRFDDH